MPDPLDDLAYLRSQATRYRELAEEQTDPRMAAMFHYLAAGFDREVITKRGVSLTEGQRRRG